MKLIHLLWRIIWNIKTIVITLFFVSSVVLNVALFLGGSLYSTINNGFETLTGIQTVGSKHESTIEKLGDDVATERQEKIRFKNELDKSSKQCTSQSSLERQLQGQLAGISAQLEAERQAKRSLTHRIDSQINQIMSEQSENQELKSQLMLCSPTEQNDG
jgi:chromosome segregation ATPase